MRDAPEIEDLGSGAGFATGDPDGPARHAAGARLGVPRNVLGSAAIVVALIGLAIVKPWGDPGGTAREPAGTPGTAAIVAGVTAASAVEADGAGLPSTGAGALSPAARLPSASVAPAGPVLAPGQLGCGAPDGWRLVTLGWLAGRGSSTQSATSALTRAAGPQDPAIPSLPVGEAPVVAVGACEPGPAPGGADDRLTRSPVRVVAAWRVDRGTPARVSLRTRGPAATAAGIVQLYAPPGGSWGPGRYVLELVAAPTADPVWVGFTVSATSPLASGTFAP